MVWRSNYSGYRQWLAKTANKFHGPGGVLFWQNTK